MILLIRHIDYLPAPADALTVGVPSMNIDDDDADGASHADAADVEEEKFAHNRNSKTGGRHNFDQQEKEYGQRDQDSHAARQSLTLRR